LRCPREYRGRFVPGGIQEPRYSQPILAGMTKGPCSLSETSRRARRKPARLSHRRRPDRPARRRVNRPRFASSRRSRGPAKFRPPTVPPVNSTDRRVRPPSPDVIRRASLQRWPPASAACRLSQAAPVPSLGKEGVACPPGARRADPRAVVLARRVAFGMRAGRVRAEGNARNPCR